ncbi:ABC transporter permease [Mesoplasma syrphidae]|uniref:ABC transporter permease n=1 Tax=Mesoplasma syrphidae TaxID=225999 RepID=A0A2K9C8W7_9MOLU|nr:ABC transporter permease [Mesoplasma syrphidae]AUF83465.1 ABC transporter permease [Mesoplasma syrphidae]
MKQIIKSYMKTFFKNWVSTIGTLIFIIILATMIIGLLSTPLQMNSRIKEIEKHTTQYNSKMVAANYSEKFVLEYILNPQNDYKKTGNTDETVINSPKIDLSNYQEYTYPFLTGDNGQAISIRSGIISKFGIEMINSMVNDLLNIDESSDSFSSFENVKLSKEKQELIKLYITNYAQNFLYSFESKELNRWSPFKINLKYDKDGSNIEKNLFENQKYKDYLKFFSSAFIEYSVREFADIGIKVDGNNFFESLIKIIKEINANDQQTDEYLRNQFNGTLYQQIGTYISSIPERKHDFTKLRNEIYQILISKNNEASIVENLKNKVKEVITKEYQELMNGTEFKDPSKENEFLENKNISIPFVTTLAINPSFKNELKNYSYSFDQYVAEKVIFNKRNRLAHDGNNNFKFMLEKEDVFSIVKKNSTSVGSSFSINIGSNILNGKINQVYIQEGHQPQKWNPQDYLTKVPEIVISETYAKANNIQIGDILSETLNFSSSSLDSSEYDKEKAFYNSAIKFRVVGFGIKHDDITPGRSYSSAVQEFKNYTYGYIDSNFLAILKNNLRSNVSYEGINTGTKIRIKNLTKSDDTPQTLFSSDPANYKTLIFDTQKNPKIFEKYKDSWEYNRLNLIKIQILIYELMGVAVLVLAFIFINFLIKKEMNETRKQLGVFKSFGYKVTELSWIFALKTLIIIFSGLLIGYFCSIPLQMFSASTSVKSVMFIFSQVYISLPFAALIFVAIPLVFLSISYGITILYIKEPALKLINEKSKISRSASKTTWVVRRLNANNAMFGYRLRRAFVRTSLSKFVVIQTLFALTSFVYALMFGAQTIFAQMSQEGFANYNDKLDHKYTYKNVSDFALSPIDRKFSLPTGVEPNKWASQLNNYRDISDFSSYNQYLNAQDDQSNSRYGIRLLVDSISNSVTSYENEKWTGINSIMPLYVSALLMRDKINDFDISLIFKDEQFSKNITDVRKWFLFSLLTYKVVGIEEDNVSYYELINKIKNNDQVDTTIEDLEKIPNIKIDFTKINKKSDELLKTLIGMKAIYASQTADQKNSNLYNSLFLSDLSKIVSMIYAMQYSQNILIQSINASGKEKVTFKEFTEAWTQLSKNSVLKNYDPKNDKYWGLINNPLIDSKKPGTITGLNSQNLKQISNTFGSQFNSSIGIDLEGIAPGLKSLIMSSMMGSKSNSIDKEKVVTFNQFLFNKKTDLLIKNISVLNVNPDKTDNLQLSLVDFKENAYGNIYSAYNFTGVTQQQIDQTTEINDDGSLNVIIPYSVARADNLKVGSKFQIKTKDKKYAQIDLKVVGINRSETFNIDTSWNLFVDYRTFAKAYFSDKLYDLMFNQKKEHLIFSSLFSQEKMLEGNIDIFNIPKSLNSLKFTGNALALELNEDTSIFYSLSLGIGKPLQMLSQYTNLKASTEIYALTNPNPVSLTKGYKAQPINLLRQGVTILASKVSQLLYIFIGLQTILLIIILVIIMNIIVEEAAVIILTLRATGYKSGQINWIIMGSYIIWAFVSFVIAFTLSTILWQVITYIAAYKWQIYISLGFDWRALIVTFLVSSMILAVGWYTSSRQVNRKPLNQITNMD